MSGTRRARTAIGATVLGTTAVGVGIGSGIVESQSDDRGGEATIGVGLQTNGCEWDEFPVSISIDASDRVKRLALEAIDEWELAALDRYGSRLDGRDIFVFVEDVDADIPIVEHDLGNVLLDGVVVDSVTGEPSPSCSDGARSGARTILINSSNADTLDDRGVRNVISHEIGHAIGLGHDANSFMGDCFPTRTIMHPFTDERIAVDGCGVNGPTFGDVGIFSRGK